MDIGIFLLQMLVLLVVSWQTLLKHLEQKIPRKLIGYVYYVMQYTLIQPTITNGKEVAILFSVKNHA